MKLLGLETASVPGGVIAKTVPVFTKIAIPAINIIRLIHTVHNIDNFLKELMLLLAFLPMSNTDDFTLLDNNI